ncbi:Neuroendocrine convertase 2 [Heterocephalus glaber]|uniref:Neuroendocrine convertase 2 n=1 Tax=Heterocephalus glaber TaxID=10181 RepID=G5CB98_HETGA|nr:Neuroendocrine convertase 2 [Heterocephalus glaber]
MKGACGSRWQAAAGLLFCVMVSASAERPIFTNHFLVELHKGGEEEARQVAGEHGFGVRKRKNRFPPTGHQEWTLLFTSVFPDPAPVQGFPTSRELGPCSFLGTRAS